MPILLGALLIALTFVMCVLVAIIEVFKNWDFAEMDKWDRLREWIKLEQNKGDTKRCQREHQEH